MFLKKEIIIYPCQIFRHKELEKKTTGEYIMNKMNLTLWSFVWSKPLRDRTNGTKHSLCLKSLIKFID